MERGKMGGLQSFLEVRQSVTFTLTLPWSLSGPMFSLAAVGFFRPGNDGLSQQREAPSIRMLLSCELRCLLWRSRTLLGEGSGRGRSVCVAQLRRREEVGGGGKASRARILVMRLSISCLRQCRLMVPVWRKGRVVGSLSNYCMQLLDNNRFIQSQPPIHPLHPPFLPHPSLPGVEDVRQQWLFYLDQQRYNFIGMFSFLNSCGFCSNIPKSGDYAYEVFNKVPTIGGIFGNLSTLITKLPQGNSLIGAVGALIGGQHGGLDLSKFINNTPSQSLVAGDSVFKDLLVGTQNGVIKKVLKSNYAQLIKEHTESGQKFTDPQFPPDKSSLGNIEDLKIKATWKRIPDIIKNAQFVSGQIEPGDILQGSIGDCYFLSAISSIAENDFRIKNIFPSLEINKYGIYMARVLNKGVLTQVVVDDYVPVNEQGEPLFAKPAGGREIWVMLLEKVWAKLNGTYGDIVGGLPNQVLHAFTGAPTDYRDVPRQPQKQTELWAQLWEAYSKGAILCCGTKGDDSVEKYGFVKGHAYTILSLYQAPYKMLKIRNPWGHKEWSGRASDGDRQFWSTISPNDRQKMGYSDKNDGIFFILWQDFVNYFFMVDICRINDNASFTNLDAEFSKKNAELFEFETTGGSVTVELSQDAKRNSKAYIENRFARSVVIVARHDEAAQGYQYKYVDSSTSQLAQHNIHLGNLPKGKYVLYVKYDWIYNNPDSAGVSLYAETPIHLVKVKQSKHDNLLYKVFLDHARNNSKKQIIGTPNQWVCSDLLLSKCGYGYIAFHLDEHSSRRLGVEINEGDYLEKRFVLKKPYRGRGVIKTTVQAGKELIVLFRLKSQTFPSSITLPAPKIYNLV